MTLRMFAAGLALASLAIAPGPSAAEEGGHSLEQIVVEMATTPAGHAALAAHYRAKADEARAEMRNHESMARSYNGGKLVLKQRMKRHCDNIAQEYAAMAKEYDGLAQLHAEEAKKSE